MMGSMTTPLYCQGRLAESMSELTPYHRMIEAVETAGLRMDDYRGSCDGPEATHGNLKLQRITAAAFPKPLPENSTTNRQISWNIN